MSEILLEGVPRRGLVLLSVLLALLVALPLVVNDYLITVLILILYFAYVGQAWNLMMGFAGQLSLGHALYVGLGAYAAAALYVHFGVSPWIGLGASIAISAAAGAVIGFLAFRFGVSGVYFAILTIAFAEFARIGFDHWRWVGGSAGFFLPVANYTRNDLWNLRGSPTMFYYLMLAMTVGRLRALPRCCSQPRRLLLARHPREPRGGAGAGHRHLPLQDVRGGAVGGDDVARRRGVRLLLQQPVPRAGVPHLALDRADPGPDHRRHRHAVRAHRRRVRADCARRSAAARSCMRFGIDIPGIKQVFYGVCLLVVVMFLPDGIWPPLSKALGLDGKRIRRQAGKATRAAGLTWQRCSSSAPCRRASAASRPCRT